MGVQMTVRVPDALAAFVDDQVARGVVASRAEAIARALALLQQRQEALRDLEIIKAAGPEPYPDLADVADSAGVAFGGLD
jgi:Arc/MetJ-type ribon-helix-helix transcriptional regulator